MANTSDLKIVKDYVVEQMAIRYGKKLTRKAIEIGLYGKCKEFDGVSERRDVVITVVNHSGKTKGKKKPAGKINKAFAECYFLSLTDAVKKVLVITDEDFFNIFMEASFGIRGDIDILHFRLPSEMEAIVARVVKNASDEMTNQD